jgi:hypothetical protein
VRRPIGTANSVAEVARFSKLISPQTKTGFLLALRSLAACRFPTIALVLGRLVFCAERETKCGSLAGLRLSPDSPSVLADDALHSCESYTRSFKFIRAMKSLKRAEKPMGIL